MILKKSKTKWIDVKGFEGVRVKIDYATPEQQEELRELQFVILYNNPNLIKKDKDEFEDLTPEQMAKQNRYAEKLAKLRIRYHVKGWENVTDEKGENVEIKLVNGIIEKELFNSFISNFSLMQMVELGNLIQDETEFNEADKKKSFSEESVS